MYTILMQRRFRSDFVKDPCYIIVCRRSSLSPSLSLYIYIYMYMLIYVVLYHYVIAEVNNNDIL